MKYLVILIMLFSNFVLSEVEYYYILTKTNFADDGTPITDFLTMPYDKNNKNIPIYIRMFSKRQCDTEIFLLYRWHKKQMSEGNYNDNNKTVKVELIEPKYSSGLVKLLVEKENSDKAYTTCAFFPTIKGGPITQIIKDK